MRRVWLVLLLLALLLGGLQYKLWFGHGGQFAVAALRGQVAGQEAENSRLQARNDALAAEVADLKAGGEAVEERARSELGMVKPGETFYRVIDADAAPLQVPPTAAPTAAPTVATPPAPTAIPTAAPLPPPADPLPGDADAGHAEDAGGAVSEADAQ